MLPLRFAQVFDSRAQHDKGGAQCDNQDIALREVISPNVLFHTLKFRFFGITYYAVIIGECRKQQ